MHLRSISIPIILIASLVGAGAGCGKPAMNGGPIASGKLKDGIYDGAASSWPNSAKVRIMVREGRIEKIDLLSHYASWVGKKAEGPIPARIIEQQSTRVDAVTGATGSSRVIMNAVQDAVEKAGVR